MSEDYQIDWHKVNHEQLVYCEETVVLEGKPTVDYKWSVLATNPTSTDAAWVERRRLLHSLRMHVPTKDDLARNDRRVLDAYLANGLGIELHDKRHERSTDGSAFDFALGALPIINDRQFVLTLDFVMKMLSMNERIECRVPCIMEGETGVSKTAITRMLFALKNTTARSIGLLEQAIMHAKARFCDTKDPSQLRLFVLHALAEDHWRVGEAVQSTEAWKDFEKLAHSICVNVCAKVAGEVLADILSDPGLDPLAEDTLVDATVIATCRQMSLAAKGASPEATWPEAAAKLLIWYLTTKIHSSKRSLDWTFFPVDVHAALTPHDIAANGFTGVQTVVARAKRLLEVAKLLDSELHRKATLCLFFDEFNTSSCMGVFKELLIDHSFDGELLPANIVVVAAGNPSRAKIEINPDSRDEQGHQWAIGNFQVHPLPATMKQMMWDYGSLKPDQELEFISKRLRFLQAKEGLLDNEVKTLIDLVYASQKETRDLAREHIKHCVEQSGCAISEKELDSRASSSVSLRDILRVFKLFSFLNSCCGEMEAVFLPGVKSLQQRRHRAMLLSLAICYFVRLGSDTSDLDKDYRRRFRTRLKTECGQQDADVEGALEKAMAALMKQTSLEPGIAQTQGLKENLFMVVICCLAQVPLMIVGPPGSSKTLAVTVVSENARGEYSKSNFYKAAPTLIPFHYQCSRRSSSKEIEAVFERAIERQAKADNEKTGAIRCFVFMDEAGLPEEERESLKVLHYYLEDHMAVAAQVGFVAITNHLLDAAKANRCAQLTRAKPDHKELMSIARGCLGSEDERLRLVSSVPAVDDRGRQVILALDSTDDRQRSSLLDKLCETYDACMSGVRTPIIAKPPPADFVCLFGLRDFMHFVKLLGRLALADSANPTVSREKIVEALERNMNGVEPARLHEILDYFLAPYDVAEHAAASTSTAPPSPTRVLRNPLDLMLASLKEQSEQSEHAKPISRYKLVIDTTTNDSILRYLQSQLSATTVKLSSFPEDSAVQQINAISAVKWAAEKGDPVMLSQTHGIDESFYDLYNQSFRKFEDRTKDGVCITYHSNIAVGPHSRRCKVTSGFQPIVHMQLEGEEGSGGLKLAPAPFLNRFEKYRLTNADLLESHLRRTTLLTEVPLLGELLCAPDLVAHLHSFVERIGANRFYGFAPSQTIESGLLRVLSSWTTKEDVVDDVVALCQDERFRHAVEAELEGRGPEAKACLQWDDPTALHGLILRPCDGLEKDVGLALLAQGMLHRLIRLLMQVAIPEHLFKHPDSLPSGLLQSYLSDQQEHFSLNALLKKMVSSATRCHMVYTRTSAAILNLLSYDARSTDPAKWSEWRKIAELIGSGVAIPYNFSLFTREPQLALTLDNFLRPEEPHKLLLLIIDGTQTQMSQVNFARHKIDELLSRVGTTCRAAADQKSIALVLHVPAADMLVHAVYDTTFCRNWSTTFLDSVEDAGVAAWLELGVGLQTSWDMMPSLERWLPATLSTIARFTEFPTETLNIPSIKGVGVLERRKAVLQMVLEIDLNGTSVKTVLLQHYRDLWAGDDGSFNLLREQMRKKIAALAAGELQVSLVEALTGEVREMFAKYVMQMLCAACANDNAHVLLARPMPLPRLVTDCFEALCKRQSDKSDKQSKMAELTGPLRPVKLGAPSESPPQVLSRRSSLTWPSSFPFFSFLAKLVDVAATQAIKEMEKEQNGMDEDGMDEDIDDDTLSARAAQRANSKAMVSKDVFAPVVRISLLGSAVHPDVWQRYLNQFVARLYPCESLQHKVIRAWLIAKVGKLDNPASSCKVACLHVAFQQNEKLLRALASLIDPITALAPSTDVHQSLLAVIDDTGAIELKLNAALVKAFYDLMQQTDQPDALLRWADSFKAARLSDLPPQTPGVDYKQIDAMLVIEGTLRRKRDAAAQIIASQLPKRLDEIITSCQPRLSLENIWSELESRQLTSAPVCRSIAEDWSRSRAALSGPDLRCLVTRVMCSTALHTVQCAALIEMLLLAQEPAQLRKTLNAITTANAKSSIIAWLEALLEADWSRLESSINVIEAHLKLEADGMDRDQPPWFRPASSVEQPLTRAVFQLLWKWLLLRHAKDELSALAKLAQDLQTARKLDSMPTVRSIALSAVRVLIIDHLAARIAKEAQGSLLNHGDESDRVMGQIEAMTDSSGAGALWAGELALAVLLKLKRNDERCIKILTTRATREDDTNRVVADWVREAVKIVDPNCKDAPTIDAPSFAKSRPKLLVPSFSADLSLLSLLGMQLSSAMIVSSSMAASDPVAFLRELVWRRATLRRMWVLPDLLEFYSWIAGQLDSRVTEDYARQLTVGQILERLKSHEGYEEYEMRRNLWLRVKVGVNNWNAHERVVNATCLDENLSLWCILSKKDDTSHDCLHKAISLMLKAFSEFTKGAGVVSAAMKPGEDIRPLFDVLSETNVRKLQDSLTPHPDLQDRLDVAELAEKLASEVQLHHESLDSIGPLARHVESHCTSGATIVEPEKMITFDFTSIRVELNDLWALLRPLPDASRFRKVCRFKSSEGSVTAFKQHGTQHHFYVYYHSLSYDGLRELATALEPIKEFAEMSNPDGTVRDKLMEMYPGAAEDEYLTRAYIDLEEEEQRTVLLGTPAADLSQLCEFLHEQIQSEAYRYARKSLELKLPWTAAVDAALGNLATDYKGTLAADARRLETALIKHERHIAAAPDKPIITCLARAFLSQEKLLEELPILSELMRAAATVEGFQFVGGHYVKLREQLRSWAAMQPSTTSQNHELPWTWPFLFAKHQARDLVPTQASEGLLRARMTPWFLLEPPEVEAVRKEREDFERMQAIRKAEELDSKRTMDAASAASADSAESPHMAVKMPANTRQPGQKKKRSLGGLGAALEADERGARKAAAAQNLAKEKLLALCESSAPAPVSMLDDLKEALQAAKDAGVSDNEPIVQNAMQMRETLEKARVQTKAALLKAYSTRPLNDSDLRDVLKRATAVGLPPDSFEVAQATQLINQVTRAQETLHDCLTNSFPSKDALRDALTAANELQLADPAKDKAVCLLRELEAEEAHFAGEAKRRWGAQVGSKLVQASGEWWQAGSSAVSSTDWPTNTRARTEAEKVIAALAKSSDRASVDAAEELLSKQPLEPWAHSKAYLAVAYTCTSNIKEYASDAKEMIEEYMEKIVEDEDATVVPAVLLAVARLCSDAKEDMFKAACLRRCYVHETQALLTADEQRIACSPVGAKLEAPLMTPATSNGETPMARWNRLKAEPGAKPSPSLDKLMEMIGLKRVKEEALELYTRVLREQGLPADRRVPFAQNFAFLGNPGTGKTSVAKLFGKILKETGAREKDVFVVSKGEELARDGADKAAKLISSAMGGVLFIDEAYALEPLTNTEGKAVAMQLLDVAEERRNDLTIIIAGYKDDIETKLFGFNSGFSSRFSCQITFEDYTEPELAEIFQSKCKEMKVPPEKHVVEVAARRLARGRGARGFGNARAVRILFDKARSRALVRDAALTSLKVIDVMGPRPDRDNVPDLGRALDELQEMIGLDSVKQSIERIVTLAQTNYDRELKGSPPFSIPLNRVFLGNPGTGKTTVAKIYGRILKGLDLSLIHI